MFALLFIKDQKSGEKKGSSRWDMSTWAEMKGMVEHTETFVQIIFSTYSNTTLVSFHFHKNELFSVDHSEYGNVPRSL